MESSTVKNRSELCSIARKLASRGKGILAADESIGTIGKRLIAIGLENSEENRRQFREILLCADNANSLAGVILFHETIMQSASDGTPFPKVLSDKGILVGVKVDSGLKPVADSPDETTTSGLDGLEERCKDYYRRGARFAKWRGALKIDVVRGLPSEAAVQANATCLSKYAKIAQSCGLVPIVEPEILIDGIHDANVSSRVAKRVISDCYAALRRDGVLLEATLLKPMMILPGVSNPDRAKVTPEQIARMTLDCMRDVVPAEVPGIMFLSGGMSEVQATKNLNALNRLAETEGAPWTLSFSFGRALQSSAMKIWDGKKENVRAASDAAAKMACVNAQAQVGKYAGPEHPSLTEDQSLYEGFRGWRSGDDPKGV
jgi:fructose-bisphosphate aldolase, class I